MKRIAILIILAFTLKSFGQTQFDKSKISKQIAKIVTKIEKTNIVMGSAIGYSGEAPKQYDNFIGLCNKAQATELMALTKHQNQTVRCYAFWALSMRQSVDLFPIVMDHINDTASVYILFGCVMHSEKVADFFISVVTRNHVDLATRKLSTTEQERLDSILIYTPNTLEARERAIDNIKQTTAYYPKIREFVLKENNQKALIKLAEYQKEQDIPLILNNKTNDTTDESPYSTFLAIAAFPSPQFFPLLEKNLQRILAQKEPYPDGLYSLYQAIASYKNDTAYKLLHTPLTTIKEKYSRRNYLKSVFDAVLKYYSPIYEPLLWELWENDKIVDIESFNLLYQKNPERAFQLTKQAMQDIDDYSSPVLDTMLNALWIKDSLFTLDIIDKNSRNSDVFRFSAFADKALEIKNISLAAAFLDRLAREDNPHIYLKATEVLIALKNKDINKQIIAVAKRNPALRKGWGREAFKKLLKKKHIE